MGWPPPNRGVSSSKSDRARVGNGPLLHLSTESETADAAIAAGRNRADAMHVSRSTQYVVQVRPPGLDLWADVIYGMPIDDEHSARSRLADLFGREQHLPVEDRRSFRIVRRAVVDEEV